MPGIVELRDRGWFPHSDDDLPVEMPSALKEMEHLATSIAQRRTGSVESVLNEGRRRLQRVALHELRHPAGELVAEVSLADTPRGRLGRAIAGRAKLLEARPPDHVMRQLADLHAFASRCRAVCARPVSFVAASIKRTTQRSRRCTWAAVSVRRKVQNWSGKSGLPPRPVGTPEVADAPRREAPRRRVGAWLAQIAGEITLAAPRPSRLPLSGKAVGAMLDRRLTRGVLFATHPFLGTGAEVTTRLRPVHSTVDGGVVNTLQFERAVPGSGRPERCAV